MMMVVTKQCSLIKSINKLNEMILFVVVYRIGGGWNLVKFETKFICISREKERKRELLSLLVYCIEYSRDVHLFRLFFFIRELRWNKQVRNDFFFFCWITSLIRFGSVQFGSVDCWWWWCYCSFSWREKKTLFFILN